MVMPVFNQIFLAGILVQCGCRRQCTDCAEWMRTRLVDGEMVKISMMVVIALPSYWSWFLAMRFVVLGKFIEYLFPWRKCFSLNIPFEICTSLRTPFYASYLLQLPPYTSYRCMHEIVWADVLQFSIMDFLCHSLLVLSMIAGFTGGPTGCPYCWLDAILRFFGWKLVLLAKANCWSWMKKSCLMVFSLFSHICYDTCLTALFKKCRWA